VAAITVHTNGGGVAAVSRLLLSAVRERWGAGVPLIPLVEHGVDPRRPEPGLAARVRFGARIASCQALGRTSWIFFTHLAVARAQAFVPAVLRQPYAVFLHGIEAWRPLTPAEGHVLDRAALRVANSSFTARRIREANPAVGEIAVCPLALPRGWPMATPGQAAPSFGPQAVLVLARMLAAERYKGHDQLLAAWPRVLARMPDARLVLAGDGDDVPRLKALARGLDGSVVFTGFVPDADLPALYDAAALFAMPSRGEGFGLVYLEAMSRGLACIGSVHDAAGEIIQDGVTGFLVNQDDPAQLADRIIALLEDEPRRRAMGQQGRQVVRRTFQYEQFSARLIALLDETLGDARVGALAAARSSR
jgi:phosphatidylinositol alpha-1,6-mannosyltransferase